MFYHTGSKYNTAAALDGPVQSSYRAELKALVGVFRTHYQPTLVMCDCQSVVDTFRVFLDGRVPRTGLREQDLWDEIFHLLSDLPDDMLSIQWMPSHCSEQGNETKVEKLV